MGSEKAKREELAWAAGFFDGEGGFFITGPARGIKRQVVAVVTQKDEELLKKFRRIIGFGPIYMWQNGSHAGQWRTGHFMLVQQTACLLWPWLSHVKRGQAKKVLLAYRRYWPLRKTTGLLENDLGDIRYRKP